MRTRSLLTADAGVHAITAQVGLVNEDPRRGIGHDRPLTRIVLDDVTGDAEDGRCLCSSGWLLGEG